jgi:hypothetical protein
VKERKEAELPNLMKSRKLNALPIRAIPYIDWELPNLPNVLNENELPTVR